MSILYQYEGNFHSKVGTACNSLESAELPGNSEGCLWRANGSTARVAVTDRIFTVGLNRFPVVLFHRLVTGSLMRSRAIC